MAKHRLSALAQLCRYLARDGITSTDALVAETGYSRRAIFAARAELQQVQPAAVQPSAPVQPAAPKSAAECTPECSPLHSEPRVRARIETPSGLVIPRVVSEESPLPPEERVALSQGRLIVCDDFRKFWLDEFGGDDKRLDLALIEVSGRVQTACSRPLEAQVSSQLARIAADKRDRDRRYAEASERNKATAAAPRETAREAKLRRDREILVELGVLS